VNAILKRVHQTITAMLRMADIIDMADTVNKSDIADFLTHAAWAFCSTYHTVLKTSPGKAIFEWGMLFDIPFFTDCSKIGEYRQKQKDNNTNRENSAGVGQSTRRQSTAA